jgi:hypothetical protein
MAVSGILTIVQAELANQSGALALFRCLRFDVCRGDPSLPLGVMGDHEALSRAELIDVTRRLQAAEGSEPEQERLLELLLASVPDPHVADLIYWPPSPLTPEEIVDRALAYKPFML